MTKKDLATEIFLDGKNCAQSILLSYADDLKLDRKTAENITSGFGAGMGRLQKTCGAVTGSFMVISLWNSLKIKDEKERSGTTTQMIQELESDFSEEFGLTECSSIIDVDLRTEEGTQKFNELNMKQGICAKCVGACASWLEKRL